MKRIPLVLLALFLTSAAEAATLRIEYELRAAVSSSVPNAPGPEQDAILNLGWIYGSGAISFAATGGVHSSSEGYVLHGPVQLHGGTIMGTIDLGLLGGFHGPLTLNLFENPNGQLLSDGRIQFDQTLSLKGSLQCRPSFCTGMTGPIVISPAHLTYPLLEAEATSAGNLLPTLELTPVGGAFGAYFSNGTGVGIRISLGLSATEISRHYVPEPHGTHLLSLACAAFVIGIRKRKALQPSRATKA